MLFGFTNTFKEKKTYNKFRVCVIVLRIEPTFSPSRKSLFRPTQPLWFVGFRPNCFWPAPTDLHDSHNVHLVVFQRFVVESNRLKKFFLILFVVFFLNYHAHPPCNKTLTRCSPNVIVQYVMLRRAINSRNCNVYRTAYVWRR